MSKIGFVTGGTGFVGSHLAEALLARGYTEVRCLVRTRRKWLKGVPVIAVRGTLADRTLIEDAVRGADYIYHLGGLTRAPTEAALHEGNVQATTDLLDAVKAVNPGVQKVLVTSSLAAVGAALDGFADESTPLKPISRYGQSKADMEAALMDYYAHLPLVVVRPPSVYGPRDRDIYTFFKAVQQRFCPILRGDSGLTLVHANDLVRGMIEAAESEATAGETYFIGNDEPITWQKLKQATTAALGRRAMTVPVPRSLVLPMAAAVEGAGALFGRYPPFNREKGRELLYAAKRCSSTKAEHDFGYQPRTDLREGLQSTIDWYRQEGWLG